MISIEWLVLRILCKFIRIVLSIYYKLDFLIDCVIDFNFSVNWKRVWQLVSGIHHETPESIVMEELLLVSTELQDGILQYRSSSSSTVKLEDLLAEKKQQKLLEFTQKLQDLLVCLKKYSVFGLINFYLLAKSYLFRIWTVSNAGKLCVII